MIRLVHLGSPVGFPTQQAHGVQMTAMCEAFADSGLATYLFCAQPPESGPAGSIMDVYAAYGLRPAFEIRPLRCLDWRWLARRLPRAWRLIRETSYALNVFFKVMWQFNNEGTIVYSRDRFSSYLLLLAGRFLRAVHIFESHTFLAERHRLLIMFLLKRLDRLVASTPFIGERYVAAGLPADMLVVAPNGVDLARFDVAESRAECRRRLGLPVDRPVVAYVGNFRNTLGMEKGVPELMQAHRHLVDRSPDPKPLLACVGGPVERIPHYRSLAERLGLANGQIIFPGFAGRSDVPCWLRAADVLTIPWPDNEWAAYQTSPIKLFEYMASGTPIVASDLPSLRLVLTDDETAALVPAGDSLAFAGAITELLENPERAGRIGATARAAVREYTLEARVKRVLEGLL